MLTFLVFLWISFGIMTVLKKIPLSFCSVFIWLLKIKLNKPPPGLFSKPESERSWISLAIKASLVAFVGNSITGLSLFVGTTLWLKITWLKFILAYSLTGCFFGSSLAICFSSAVRNFSPISFLTFWWTFSKFAIFSSNFRICSNAGSTLSF